MLESYLRRQDGVITLAQSRRAGLSDSAVRRRVRSGQWRRHGPGIYFAADRPFTDAARIRATVWSYGIHAAASGLAAAWWLGLVATAPEVVEVTVPRNSHGRSHAGSRVRRRNLSPADIVERGWLRVTAPALTVLEAAVRPRGGPAIMDSALQRQLGLPQLQRTHLRNKGRYGSAAADRLLTAASSGARSHAERLLIQLLEQARISGWQANYPVAGYRVDIAFPLQKVAVELDGWAFHSNPEAFQTDRLRQNQIALNGWQVLRFTWLDLTETPNRVVAQICASISAR